MALQNLTPVAHIFTKNPHQFSGQSSRHRGQLSNSGAYVLNFSAIPSNGQIIAISWFGGLQVLTGVSSIDDTGNTFRTTSGTTVSTWLATVFFADILLNYELTRDFKITIAGPQISFFPLNYDQELNFELAPSTTAPVTLVSSNVTRRLVDQDYAVACRIFTGLKFSTFSIISEEFYTPSIGAFTFRPGDIINDYITHYVPGLGIIPFYNELVTIYPYSHILWGYELAEYRISTGEYFALTTSASKIAFKGALSSNTHNDYFNSGLIVKQLSNYPNKVITEKQADHIYFFINDANANNTWQIAKEVTVTNIAGGTTVYTVPINGNVFNTVVKERIVYVEGGYAGAKIAQNINPLLIPDIFKVEIRLLATVNGTPIGEVLKRSYSILEPHFLDKFFVYTNSYGVPEMLRLRGARKINLEVNKEEFIKANPAVKASHERNIDYYNIYHRFNDSISSGFLTKSRALLLTEFFNSPAVYETKGQFEDYKAINISPDKFELNDELDELIAINFSALSAQKERGYSL